MSIEIAGWPGRNLFKRVEWAYATSDNARRFGFDRQGCWVVETVERSRCAGGGQMPPCAIAGFATREEAKGFAEGIQDMPWDRLTR